MTRAVLLGAVLAALAAAACGGSPDRQVEGLVIDVQGNLTVVDAFVVRTAGGEVFEFVPSNDAVFGDEGPLSHLRDHLRSGEPVVVSYRSRDGSLVAENVDDVSGGG